MTQMTRDLSPVPGIPQEDLKQLSRQQRYKLRRFSQGLCTSCGKHPRQESSRSLCVECLKTQRERMRQRTGAKRRNLKSKSYVADPAVKAMRKAVAPKKARAAAAKKRATTARTKAKTKNGRSR